MNMLPDGERTNPIDWSLQTGDWSNLTDRETLVQDMLNLGLLSLLDPAASLRFQERMFTENGSDFIRARLDLHKDVRDRIKEGALPNLSIDELDVFENGTIDAATPENAIDRISQFVAKFQTSRDPRTLGH